MKKTYEKSDLLQILRILKNYDLLKSGQMDLFAPSRRRKPINRAAGEAETDELSLTEGSEPAGEE